MAYDWPGNVRDLQKVERSNILRALRDSDWKVKGEGDVALRLGLKPSTLQSRMKKLGITRPQLVAEPGFDSG